MFAQFDLWHQPVVQGMADKALSDLVVHHPPFILAHRRPPLTDISGQLGLLIVDFGGVKKAGSSGEAIDEGSSDMRSDVCVGKTARNKQRYASLPAAHV